MPFLMPGKRIRTLLGHAGAFHASDEPNTIAIEVDYRDSHGVPRSTSVEHDFSVYRDLIMVIG